MEVLPVHMAEENKSTSLTEAKSNKNEHNVEYKWMPHLRDAVPTAGQGKRISTYTVALEGWRRGMQLTFYSVFEDGNKLKVRYSLEHKNKVHHFSLSMGDKVSEEAFRICDDKDLTKQYLAKGNVPIPQGKMFDPTASDEEIVKYGLSLGFPIVVKPTDGNAGKGVFANIRDEKSLREIVPHVRNDLNFSNIIVENYVSGEEFRIIVIEDKVLGAMNRRPAFVTGDGVHTIRELIYQKNKERKINPHLTSRMIKIDKEIKDLLKSNDYQLSSIPDDNKVVYLRQKSNLSAGGEAEDVTEQLTPELKRIAIDVGKAIPGLPHYGVDMIVSNDRSSGVILEVNSRPGLGGHLFPGKGEPRDFAKAIIDYYFPETKDIERTDLYFDFDSVLEPVKNRTASHVNVIKPPVGKFYSRKYTVSGKFNTRNYRQYIRHEAIKRNMHGYTALTEDKKVIVMVGSNDEVEVIQFKDVCLAENTDMAVKDIEELVFNRPIQMGFETKEDHKLTNSEIRKVVAEHQEYKEELARLNKRYAQIYRSRAWRATYPVRATLHAIKQFFRKMTGRR